MKKTIPLRLASLLTVAGHVFEATGAQPPVVTVDDATVTVFEGELATNTGGFSDPDGDTVTITSSVGTVASFGGLPGVFVDGGPFPSARDTTDVELAATETGSPSSQSQCSFALVQLAILHTVHSRRSVRRDEEEITEKGAPSQLT